MELRNLKMNEIFYFENDKEQVQFLIVFESTTTLQFDALSKYNSTSFCVKKEWDFLAKSKVIKIETI